MKILKINIFKTLVKKTPIKQKQIPRLGKLVLQGNPKIGSVIHFRQLHDAPNMFISTKKDSTFNGLFKGLIGKYQFKILKDLARLKIKHIFSENLDIVLNQRILRTYDSTNGDYYNNVLKIFPNGIPNDPNEDQLDMSRRYGASIIYACLNSDVTIHETMTEKEYLKIKKMADHDREIIATGMIMQFFKKNKGVKVALIYGAGHDFSDAFKKLIKTPPIIFRHIYKTIGRKQ